MVVLIVVLYSVGVLMLGLGLGEIVGRRKSWPGRPRKDLKTGRFVKGK